MCSLSAASLARQGARVAHVFVATCIKALRTCSPASPVRTAAVLGALARPHVHRRRLQLSYQQLLRRSLPAFSCNRASEHPAAGLFIDENRPSWPTAGRMFSSMKKWGPRCRNSALSRVGVIRPPGVGIYRPVEPVPRGVSNDPVEGRYFAGFWGLFEGVFFEAGGTFGSRYERPLSSRQ